MADNVNYHKYYRIIMGANINFKDVKDGQNKLRANLNLKAEKQPIGSVKML